MSTATPGLNAEARTVLFAAYDLDLKNGNVDSAIPGLAAKDRVNPFVLILSDNDTKLSGRITKDSFSMQPTFEAMDDLGWDVRRVENGHDLQAVYLAVEKAVADAKANPGKVYYGSSGTGGSVHMATELFNQMAGTKLTHVSYKGQGPALNDVLAGQIQFLMGSPLVIYPHVKSGRLKALAISASKRSALAPEIPTLAESGVAGLATSG